MAVPRFLAHVDPASRVVTLDEDESHHAARVLRLVAGAALVIFDGRGQEWTATVVGTARGQVTVELGAEILATAEPPVQVTLGIGLLKGDQMDSVVRDATMLGVAAIVPMVTAHVTVPTRARPSEAVVRWRRVAMASAKQSGRAVLPLILPPTPFEEIVARAEFEARIICVEPSAGSKDPASISATLPESLLLLVGPEGGWASHELEFAAAHDARYMHLGPRTLRAEAAPAVALSALWTIWGWQ